MPPARARRLAFGYAASKGASDYRCAAFHGEPERSERGGAVAGESFPPRELRSPFKSSSLARLRKASDLHKPLRHAGEGLIGMAFGV